MPAPLSGAAGGAELTPAGALLAAGAGRRFGGPKQLAVIAGEPLVRRTARALVAVAAPVFVIAGATDLHTALDGLPVQVLANPDWSRGIGTSVALAARAAQQTGARGLLVLAADQAGVDADALAPLTAAWRRDGRRVVAAAYLGTVGIPVIFPAAWFERLATLDGSSGAQALLAEAGSSLLAVPCPSAAYDIDLPGDIPSAEV